MTKRVLFRAPVLTQSGYGVHCRQIFKWLMTVPNIDVQVQVMPWGDTPWYVDSREKGGLIGEAMARTDQIKPPYDVSVQIQLPNEWDPSLASVNIGVTAGVETTTCNQDWCRACERMTHVIVPSEHTKTTFVASVDKWTARVDVVPESYIETIDSDVPQLTIPGLGPDDRAVLVHGQITGTTAATDRKNTFNTIKWLCDLLRDDPSSSIVIKTNMSRNTKIDRTITTRMIRQLLSEVRKGLNPQVILIHGSMSDEETAALYKHPSIKCLVALTRGEGFGLPILEAAASGLPVIATDWSAHIEYLGDRYVPIKHRMVPVPAQRIDKRIFIPGTQWADPDEVDFKTKFKEFWSDPTKASCSAESLSVDLRRTHSWSSVADMYTAILGGYFR